MIRSPGKDTPRSLPPRRDMSRSLPPRLDSDTPRSLPPGNETPRSLPWFKVAVSVTDSEGPETYRSRCIGLISADT